MSYLNWRDLGEQELQKSISSAPGPRAQSPETLSLTLALEQGRLSELCALIDEVFQSRAEGRIEMPQAWRLFIKPRDGESRILVAHPEENQWVLTAMLTPTDAQVLIGALRDPAFRELRLGKCIGLNPGTSNGDLVLRLQTQRSVVVVEDTAAMRELLLKVVAQLPGRVRAVGVTNGAQLRTEVRKNRPDWVLLDEILPGESGAELAQFLASEKIPFALVSATADRAAPLPPGCQARLQKPDWESLEQTVQLWSEWWKQALA